MDIRDTVEYREFGYTVVTCPVCGKETLDNHYICPTCGWEYDGSSGNEYSPANGTSVEVYKTRL